MKLQAKCRLLAFLHHSDAFGVRSCGYKQKQRLISAKYTKEQLELYKFALDWYEDHRMVDRQLIKKLALKYPFHGEAYRVSEKNFGPYTSWSKSRSALCIYSKDTPKRELIDGLDIEQLVHSILFMDPKNSDLQDLINVQEVIKL
jgi:hypothetical protein